MYLISGLFLISSAERLLFQASKLCNLGFFERSIVTILLLLIFSSRNSGYIVTSMDVSPIFAHSNTSNFVKVVRFKSMRRVELIFNALS